VCPPSLSNPWRIYAGRVVPFPTRRATYGKSPRLATVIYQVFVSSFGGALDGVTARLEHIARVGADAVYLTPIFTAPSDHKYDTTDFDSVDAGFGGEAAFARLVAATRARGLGLLLDGVFNHVGAAHPWAKEPRFLRGSVWRGYPSLPELDLANPELRDKLFGSDGVIARWTRRGATGWRLDCANDLGPEVCALAGRAAREAGATDGVIGELMAYPTVWPGLDGTMNYWLRSVALALASGQAPAAQLQGALDRLAAEVPLQALQASWSILSSHDTPRLETVLDGDPRRVRLALSLQLAYPGVPMLYYGEEIGMSGGADPANRAPMRWDEPSWNAERLALVRRLTALRRAEPALARGRYLAMPQAGTDLIAFARVTENPVETLVYVANATGEARTARLFLPLSTLYDALPLADLLDPAAPRAHMIAGCLEVALPAHGCALYRPDDAHASGYRFFK
jgi:glycosidase